MSIYMMIAIGIIALMILWFIFGYNRFVRLRNKVEEAFSTMDVYLKKRYDLIPNLVETIKGYTKNESETLEKVVAARNMAVSAKNTDDKIAGEQQMQRMLGSLFAISESYPDLKADSHYVKLMSELERVEADIANARKYFNAVVKKYNDAIQVFPNNILAALFHFKQKPLFEIQDSVQRENVHVQF